MITMKAGFMAWALASAILYIWIGPITNWSKEGAIAAVIISIPVGYITIVLIRKAGRHS